jgi:hypothetical protein
MNDWQDWDQMWDAFSKQAEQLLDEFSKGVETAVDSLFEFAEDLTEQIDQALAPGLSEFDQEMEGWMEPLIQFINTLENSFTEAAAPITHTVEPLINQHPACVGCRHYHGQSYNDTMFVCAMHPYGWAEEQCPDWESV